MAVATIVYATSCQLVDNIHKVLCELLRCSCCKYQQQLVKLSTRWQLLQQKLLVG